jgi:hypothetical protein
MISGFSRAEKLAAATRADNDEGRSVTAGSTISSLGAAVPTAANPSAAIRTIIRDPAADI